MFANMSRRCIDNIVCFSYISGKLTSKKQAKFLTQYKDLPVFPVGRQDKPWVLHIHMLHYIRKKSIRFEERFPSNAFCYSYDMD